VALAVYASESTGTRPRAVTLVDRRNWRAGVAAASLVGSPTRAPVLLTDGDEMPAATKGALARLRPRGGRPTAGTQAFRIGGAAKPEGVRTRDVKGKDDFELAAAIDRVVSVARGAPSDNVVVVGAGDAASAMPAAAWAAKSGDPVLFVERDGVPAPTRAALTAHQQPRIYVVGPESAVGSRAIDGLRRLGQVTRVSGPDAVRNAIAFARFSDSRFGWGVADPGHGLVFASTSRPLDAAAGAALSASGKYGPLLLTDSATALPAALRQYLLDIQPGYTGDPVRGVYNHGWLLGDLKAFSLRAQSRIDSLLEIAPVTSRAVG
jgi:hypothetical protein